MRSKRILIAVMLLVSFCLCSVVFTVFPVTRWNVQANNATFARLLRSEAEKAGSASGASKWAVAFSHQEHFYARDIQVYLSVPPLDAGSAYEIYYTTNGETPDKERGTLYTKPIGIRAEGAVACHVLKAVAYAENQISQVVTHTYFVGEDVHDRFDTYVFSLSSEPDGLYGYEYGILVPGRIYDEYVEANPDTDVPPRWWPANYREGGRDWERLVYVEAFRQDGERVIAQNAGLLVHGGVSRSRPQKSLRLVARKGYEVQAGRFHYDFFPDFLSADIHKNLIESHDTLILRNDGNDFGQGRIRTPLAAQIAWEAGFSVVSPQTPAAVFINGEYYGFVWLNLQINEQFLESLFSSPQRAFDIVDGGNHRVLYVTEDIEDEFNKMLNYAEQGDVEALAVHFDVENLLLYYAIKAYIGDSDWPINNVKIWRYTGPYPENGGLPKELDGRWRFVFYDADMSFGFNLSSAPDISTIHRLLEGDSPILQSMLQQPEYARMFANYICDMAGHHFSAHNVKRVMEELNDRSFQEMARSATHYSQKLENVFTSREAIIGYTDLRPGYILNELKEIFGYSGEMYHINAKGANGASAFLSAIPMKEDQGAQGCYFVENEVTLSAEPDYNHDFDYWLVNGTKRHDPVLKLSVSEGLEISVELYLKPRERDTLIINRVYYAESNDWIELYNPTGQSISTRGYFLSDDATELSKTALKGYTIEPGESLLIVCKNNKSTGTLGRPTTSFYLRAGETLYLSDSQGTVVSSVHLVRPARIGEGLMFDDGEGIYVRTTHIDVGL